MVYRRHSFDDSGATFSAAVWQGKDGGSLRDFERDLINICSVFYRGSLPLSEQATKTPIY